MSDYGLEGIQQVLERYFEALYTGDVGMFRAIFHPRAMLYCSVGSPTVILSVDEYMNIVANRAAPAQSNAPRRDEILLMDRPTPITAHARVRELFGPKQFTDDLGLILEDGAWKIVSKIWDAQE